MVSRFKEQPGRNPLARPEDLSRSHLDEVLLDSIPVSAMLIHRERTVLASNQQADEAGIDRGSYCWHSFQRSAFIPSDHKAYFDAHGTPPEGGTQCSFCRADQALQSGRRVVADRVQNGQIFEIHWAPVDDETFVHFALDVTDVREKDLGLQMVRSWFRRSQEIADLGNWHRNVSTGEVFCSDRTLLILGLKPNTAEMNIERIMSMVHPDDREVVTRATDLLIASRGKTPYDIEYRIQRPDGSTAIVRELADAVFDEDGALSHISGVIQDITERKETDEALRTNAELLRAIMENAPAIIHLKDLQGRYLMVNKRFLEWNCLDQEKFAGKTLFDLVPVETAKRHSDHDREVRELGRTVEREVIHTYPDGITRNTVQVKFPVHGQRGDIVATGGITVDVSALKSIENELREAKEIAETANAAKSSFLANMSHELRTPLNSIIGFSEMMHLEMLGALPDAYVDYADVIHKSGNHLLSVINDILDMSKIEAGKLELMAEKKNPNDVVDEAADLMASLATLNGVEIIKDYDLHAQFDVDVLRLRQCFLNILSNAIKFSPGGKVIIQTRRKRHRASIVFRDNGIGMNESEVERALEPFGQAEQKAFCRNHAGTGLGLPLARKLAELHGGNLDIVSEKGVGTTVTVSLPG